MVIKIKSENKKLFIPIPALWAFSGIGLRFLKKYDTSGTFNRLKAKDMRKIRKTIRRMRRKHKKWNLVEVETPGGAYVKIRL